MISEAQHDKAGQGRIEVICGCMFSGKTEELIRRLNEASLAQQEVAVFKPAIDLRYHREDLVSHNGRSRLRSMPVEGAEAILPLAGEAAVVGIDEAQFFDDALPGVAAQLAGKGVRVILAGLDMDATGAPFGPMPKLLAQAEFVTKLQAICSSCGGPATYSYRKTASSELILLGESDVYEARCRVCFFDT